MVTRGAIFTRRLLRFLDWIRDVVVWYVFLPATIIHWVWRWRFTALWISSLSTLYFSLIAVAYYWNTYPENAIAGSMAALTVLLTLWGYYKHKQEH